jgi:transposase-like protein
MKTPKSPRKRHDSASKARVALEAVKGIKTAQQIASEHGVHPVQVSEWKKRLCEQAEAIFSRPSAASTDDAEAKEARLLAKIGELTVQLDFLQKKSRQLGL